MALIEKLTNIADAIRGKTGKTEEMTLDQMAAEISNIQIGGGSGGTSGIYMAKVTPAEDVGEIEISHNLNTTDILLAAIWAESFGDITPTFDGAVAIIYAKSSLPFRLTSSINHENFAAYAKWSTSVTNVNVVGQPNSTVYLPKVIDENTIEFNAAGAAAAKYFAGVTYTVVVVATSAFSDMGA